MLWYKADQKRAKSKSSGTPWVLKLVPLVRSESSAEKVRQTLRKLAAEPSMGNALESLVRHFLLVQAEFPDFSWISDFCWMFTVFTYPRYASWTLTHGHRINHVTILLNSLGIPGLNTLADLNVAGRLTVKARLSKQQRLGLPPIFRPGL